MHKLCPFTEKWPRRPETGIRDGFEELEHEFPTYSDVPFLAKFSNETTQKVVFHLLSNRIGKLFVNLNTHNSLPCASGRRLGTSQRLYKIITDPNVFKF